MGNTRLDGTKLRRLITGGLEIVLVLSVILLCFMSLLALITTQWTLVKEQDFLFSPAGIATYIAAFGQYAPLFGATIGVAAAYFGLQRLDAATEANLQKERQDRFMEWRAILDVRFLEIEHKDSYMKREFIRLRRKFFNVLYDKQFVIRNKNELIEAFEVFKDQVSFFEQQNERHIELGGVYQSNNRSYSFDSFRFLFLGSIDTPYDLISDDLNELYMNALPQDREIDSRSFFSASVAAGKRGK